MIDKNKRHRIASGAPARVYATDGGDQYPIHGAYWVDGIGWKSECWTEDGRSNEFTTSKTDLVNISIQKQDYGVKK